MTETKPDEIATKFGRPHTFPCNGPGGCVCGEQEWRVRLARAISDYGAERVREERERVKPELERIEHALVALKTLLELAECTRRRSA